MASKAQKIRGITIELGADTSKFQKAMSGIDKTLRSTQSQLKDIDKLLKLDPTNTELLRQKQEALGKELQASKDKTRELKNAIAELEKSGGEGAKDQINALNRELVESEQNTKNLTKEMERFGSVTKQQLQAVGSQLKDIGGKVSDVGKDMTLKLTTPLVALGTVGVNYNAQIEQYRTMFTTLTGSAEEADRIISQLQADAQKSPFDSKSLIEANQYLISAGVSAEDARKTILDLGNAVAATGGGSDELNRMAQNLQQIKNVGKATATDIKQFANAGINIYGLLAETTGKTVEEVKEMDVSYEVLAEALAKASEEGGRYAGAMEAQSQTLNGSLSATKESIQMLLGEIMEAAMPVIVKVLEKVREVIDWLSSLDDDTKKTILIVGAVVAALGPVITIVGGIITGIGGLVTALGFLFSPIGGVIFIIGSLVAAGVALYKNWDVIKEKVGDLATSIKNKFDDIKRGITEKINSAKDTVKSAIDKIRSFFNFQWSLPHLKLPHFSISGKFSLNPPSVPHFSIDWYAKAMKNGMILNNPTIFGMMNGKLLGGGEAGSETIVGTNSLMQMIAKASKGTVVNMTINAQDQNVYELADIVMDRLTQTTQRERLVFA